jgi:hypothetical protein
MFRPLRLTALPVLAAMLLPPWQAQAQQGPSPVIPAKPADAPPLPPASRQVLAAETAIQILGRDVKEPSGTVVGQLVNVLVDGDGRPRGAVLDYGGFLGVGKQRIAVAWSVMRFERDGLHLSLSHEQLRELPDFKDGEAVTLAGPP